MKWKWILSLIFIASFLNGMNKEPSIELVPCTGRYFVSVFIKDSQIYVEDQYASHRIPTNNQNKLLRDMLKYYVMGKFLDGTYINVNKTATGKYYLSAKKPEDNQ